MREFAANAQPLRAVDPKAAIERRKQVAPHTANQLVVDGQWDIVCDALVRNCDSEEYQNRYSQVKDHKLTLEMGAHVRHNVEGRIHPIRR